MLLVLEMYIHTCKYIIKRISTQLNILIVLFKKLATREDKRIWKASANWTFTVMSAYEKVPPRFKGVTKI